MLRLCAIQAVGIVMPLSDWDLFLHRTKFARRAIPSTNCEERQINLIGGFWCDRKTLLRTKQGDVLIQARGAP